MSYEKDLAIDKNHLDDECLEQPAKYLYWAEKLVDAEDEKEKLKRKKDVVYAEAEERVRIEADLNGDKITEAKVKAKVILDSEVEQIETEYTAACKKAKLMSVAVEAFHQRKKSIEQLVQLYGLGYYSQPNGGTKEKAAKAKVVESLNKKERR